MPLYDFHCRACEHEFEALVRGVAARPECPRCGSADLERLPSLFGVSSESTSQRNLKLARRRAAGSRDRIDKQRADAEYVRNHYKDEGVQIPPVTKKDKS
jgi:putative FmdB family regulatory protein